MEDSCWQLFVPFLEVFAARRSGYEYPSVHMSVCSYDTTRELLKGFSWNLILGSFTKICQAISVFQGQRLVQLMHPTQQDSILLSFISRWSEIIHRPNSRSRFDFGHGWSWTPHSADLNPCVYFFQGLLKGKVYKYNHHPRLVEELKAEFTDAVETSLKKQRQQLRFITWEQSTEYSGHKSFKSYRDLEEDFFDINKWFWMCRDHILKIHVLWDVTLDRWMNNSTFFKAWQCLHLQGNLI